MVNAGGGVREAGGEGTCGGRMEVTLDGLAGHPASVRRAVLVCSTGPAVQTEPRVWRIQLSKPSPFPCYLHAGLTVEYRPDIDGLRCVAVLLVLIFHFDLAPAGKAGFIGVDVFFVISGYLISSIIWGQLEKGRFGLRTFYLRRFRRLAPVLVCVQLLVIAFGYLFLLPREVMDLAKQNLATQVYLINVYLWRSVGYFGLRADSVPLLHCWSLAIEEQFYLLYPLLLIGIHRFARRFFVPILATVVLGSFLLNLYFVTGKPEATFYLLPTRAWELLLGALVPFAQPWLEKRGRWRWLAALIGTGLVTAGVSSFRDGIKFPGTFALLPTMGTVALILAGAGQGSWVSRVLGVRPVVYIGKISYSLYLVHWPLKAFLRIFTVDYTLTWRWVSLALAIGMAAVLYHLIEDPVRRGAVFKTGRQFVVAYAAGFSVVMLLVASALTTHGWRDRFSPEILRIADYADDQNEATQACEYHPGSRLDMAGPCRLGQASAPATWVVAGDSHAWALSDAFSLFLEHRGEAGLLFFSHGCMPVIGLGDRACQTFGLDLMTWLERDQTTRNVVLVSIWRPFEGSLRGPDGRYLTGPAALLAFQQQFTQTLRRLHDAGKSVYVWESLPPARMSVPLALARNRAFNMHLRLETSRAQHQQQFGFMTTALDANRELVQGSISAVPAMCGSGSCMVEDHGVPLLFDNNHPARSRAPFFAKIIEEQIKAPKLIQGATR